MKFFVDHMLGRLCRWVRIMGFDAEYASIDMNDAGIVEVCAQSDRTLLTRDKTLSKRVSDSVLIESQDHREQVRQFVSIFHPDPVKLFSRCTECNGVLQRVNVTPDLGLPSGVEARFKSVFRCPSCGKLYWEGDHYHNILRSLSEMGVTDAGNP